MKNIEEIHSSRSSITVIDREEVHAGIENIEEVDTHDDPRLWSRTRKNLILAVIAFAAMSGTVSTNIFFPAIKDFQNELQATTVLVSASVSLFVFFQGATPLLWSALSEIKGRKVPYILSQILYCAATIGCALSTSITGFIFARVCQAAGSAPVLALGAGTLADIFEPEERGTKLGIYYMAYLLGPSIGPMIGGLLSEGGSWRTTFWFLEGYGVICLALMIWLPETFRPERSLAWKKAYKSAQAHARLQAKLEKLKALEDNADEKGEENEITLSELESGKTPAKMSKMSRIISGLSTKSNSEEVVKIRFADVNPFSAIGGVLSQKHNIISIFVSGLLFASQYAIAYTVSFTFAESPYDFNSIFVGLVLLCYGVGNLIGSLAGGKYSDMMLKKLKAANDGKGEPEFRISSTRIALYFLPTSLIIYAWVVQTNQHIALPLVALFVLGVATIWIYTSTLAYIVDANVGRSSSAVACNSLVRGTLAAIASQISEPLIGAIGQGWFFTGFGIIMAMGCVFLVVVERRGKAWREADDKKEKAAEEKKETEAKAEGEAEKIKSVDV